MGAGPQLVTEMAWRMPGDALPPPRRLCCRQRRTAQGGNRHGHAEGADGAGPGLRCLGRRRSGGAAGAAAARLRRLPATCTTRRSRRWPRPATSPRRAEPARLFARRAAGPQRSGELRYRQARSPTRWTMADACGRGDCRFHLVGHDWGGSLAWDIADRYPERLASLTMLSRPHPGAFNRALAPQDRDQATPLPPPQGLPRARCAAEAAGRATHAGCASGTKRSRIPPDADRETPVA